MATLQAAVRKVAPKANPAFSAALATGADAAMVRYGMGSPAVVAMFLAQCHHETAGFREFTENMNYSAARLPQVWPSRFPTVAAAKPYANNPEKLANVVYANRMGNRGPESGDGYRNRGGGLTHHTGAAEYARVKKRTGHDPDTIRNPANAVPMIDAAATYWVDRNVIEAAERNADETVTKRINGGLIGHQDRMVLKRRYVAAIDGKPIPKEATRAETAKRQAQQAVAAGSGSGGSATTGVTTVSTPKPAPSPTAGNSHNGLIIGVVCIVAAVGLAILAHRLWKKSQATKLVLEQERQQLLELRSAAPVEGGKDFPILNAGA